MANRSPSPTPVVRGALWIGLYSTDPSHGPAVKLAQAVGTVTILYCYIHVEDPLAITFEQAEFAGGPWVQIPNTGFTLPVLAADGTFTSFQLAHTQQFLRATLAGEATAEDSICFIVVEPVILIRAAT